MPTSRNTPANNKDTLSKESQAIITQMRNEFQKMKEEMMEEFTIILNAKMKEVDELKIEVKTLTEKVARLEELVDEADQYERRDCLVFFRSRSTHFC